MTHAHWRGTNFAMLKLYWEHQCWNWSKTKLSLTDWVENIYSCSWKIKTLKLVLKDWWLLQGGIVIKVYSKYIDMPLKHLHSIVVSFKCEKFIQSNDVNVNVYIGFTGHIWIYWHARHWQKPLNPFKLLLNNANIMSLE